MRQDGRRVVERGERVAGGGDPRVGEAVPRRGAPAERGPAGAQVDRRDAVGAPVDGGVQQVALPEGPRAAVGGGDVGGAVDRELLAGGQVGHDGAARVLLLLVLEHHDGVVLVEQRVRHPLVAARPAAGGARSLELGAAAGLVDGQRPAAAPRDGVFQRAGDPLPVEEGGVGLQHDGPVRRPAGGCLPGRRRRGLAARAVLRRVGRGGAGARVSSRGPAGARCPSTRRAARTSAAAGTTYRFARRHQTPMLCWKWAWLARKLL